MEISSKRLVIAFVLIFLLGVLFAIVNGQYTEEEGEQLPLVFYGIAFMSFIVGGLIVLLFQWKISKLQMNKVLKILPEKEMKIVKLLIEKGGELEQNKLVVLTGVNKVKMSRILMELEGRGVVEKKNMGNTKLIVLRV